MGIIRRVYRQGNSAVVSIPRYMWSDIDSDLGSYVEIDSYPGRMLTITHSRKEKQAVNEQKSGENVGGK